MSLNDIEASLPNGFHDAKINAVYRNLKTEIAEVYLDILVGLPDDEPIRQNDYRQGVLLFEGVKILISQEPSFESKFSHPGSINFVIIEDDAGSISQDIINILDKDYHTYTLFVQEWFSNLIIVASKVKFSWS